MIEQALIAGGGPAGLTAAIYLARFHLAVTVIDAGQSRAGLIPLTHNHAGFPGGIAGRDLLARMQQQASEFGVTILHDTVELRTGQTWAVRWGDWPTVALAVGLVAAAWLLDRRRNPNPTPPEPAAASVP